MVNINEKVILIGDTHWGINKFSLNILDDQLQLFNKQIFPYMEENNIKIIFSMGDLLDNRTKVDIAWLERLKREFFDVIKEKGYILYELLGNHDIYLRDSRDISLVELLSKEYKDNFKVFKNRELININGKNIYIVPWMTQEEKLTTEELQDVDYVFGHFEIRGFYMVPGHMNETAGLGEKFFKDNPRIKGVYSGHYHLKDTKGLIKYLGSAYQLNWSDYNDIKQFYEFDGDSIKAIENNSTRKFIKIKYDDEIKEETSDKVIEVKGYDSTPLFFSKEEYTNFLPELKKHTLKFFINKSKDENYEDIIYQMKQKDISSTIINNQEMSKLIKVDYVQSDSDVEQKDSRSLMIETVKNENKDLVPFLYKIFAEIDTENIG